MEIKVNGFKINYNLQLVESTPVVVFVHAFPLNQKMWDDQVKALQGKFSVLTYDLRGFGKSEVGDGQYMFENHVDDFIELILSLKFEKVIACGLSMGGYVILRAYEKNPSLFHGLILCDTKAEADGNEAKLRRNQMLHILKFHGKEKFIEEFIKTAFSPKTFEKKPEVVELVKGLIAENDEKGIAGNLIALSTRTDTTSLLDKIDIPTMFIVGEDDVLTPPALAREIISRIKGGELVVISNAGHLSNLENSEEFNRAILNFLEKI
jgi:3-oxoadipate enol-lactonase